MTGRRSRIESLSNPLVKRMRLLREKRHRREEGLFLAEGLRIATEAREAGILTDDAKRDLEERISGQIESAITTAERAPYPDAGEILHNVYAQGTPLGS